jgi:hypothetical protein
MWTATPDMVDLITHASESLPPQVLTRENVPSTHGFLYLPVPMVMNDVRGKPLPIYGIMWAEKELGHPGKSPGRGMPDTARGLVISLFTLNGAPDDPANDARISAKDRQMMMVGVPTLSLVHSMSLAFGRVVWDVDTSDVDGTPEEKADIARRVMRSAHDGDALEKEADGRWLIRTGEGHVIRAIPDPTVQFLHSYFHFVGSTLSSLDRERMPRSMARWLRRLGMPDDPITVVRLRRREPGAETGRGGSLSYRYVRRGHWRRQWYGSGEGRYQQHIWIAPTLCGPEDGPLRVREVVNLVQF